MSFKKNTDNIKIDMFTKDFTEESCYILGLLWADGYINKKTNSVALEMLETDLVALENIFANTGEWKKYLRSRINRKPQMTLHITNKEFSDFLKEHDYDIKSGKSADKILSIIPNHLKVYWFRGYWDGDGCFYSHAKNSLSQCTASSTLNQGWDFIAQLLESLNIDYTIRRIENKHSYSQIRFCGFSKSKIFIDYLYKDRQDLCLPRKLEKAKNMSLISIKNSEL